MESVKETLHSTIELLDDEEARQMLDYAKRLHKKDVLPPTLERLVHDPIFRVPLAKSAPFGVVQPIEGKGVAASQLLIEGRR